MCFRARGRLSPKPRGVRSKVLACPGRSEQPPPLRESASLHPRLHHTSFFSHFCPLLQGAAEGDASTQLAATGTPWSETE